MEFAERLQVRQDRPSTGGGIVTIERHDVVDLASCCRHTATRKSARAVRCSRECHEFCRGPVRQGSRRWLGEPAMSVRVNTLRQSGIGGYGVEKVCDCLRQCFLMTGRRSCRAWFRRARCRRVGPRRGSGGRHRRAGAHLPAPNYPPGTCTPGRSNSGIRT